MYTRVTRLWLDCLFLLPALFVPLLFSWDYLKHPNTNTIVIKEPYLQLSVSYLLLFLPFLWWERSRAQQRTFQWIQPSIILLASGFILYFWLSYTSVSSHPRAHHEFVRWLTYISLLLVCIIYAQDPRRFRLFIMILLLTSVIVCGYAVSQSLGFDFYPWESFATEQNVRRVTSTMGNPDFLAGYLVALIPLTLICALIQKGWVRIWLGFVLLLQVVSLILSHSRGGWVATFITALILFSALTYINWIREPVLLRPIVTLRAAVASITFMALLGIATLILFWNDFAAAMYRFTHLTEGLSVTNRSYFYEGAWLMWKDHPFFGLGIGMFASHFGDYRDKELSKYLPFQQWNLEHVHNEFLEIAAETGLIGLLLYLALISVVFLTIWRTARRYRTRENLILLGLLGGILGTLIHNLFTVTLRHTISSFLLWSFLGTAVGYALSLRKRNERFKTLTVIIYAFMFTLLPYLYSFSVINYQGDALIASSANLLQEVDTTEGIARYQADMERIFYTLHKGKRLAPDLYESYNWLGAAYGAYHDYAQQKREYLELIQLNKDFTSVNMNLGVTYFKQGRSIDDLVWHDRRFVFQQLSRHCLEESKIWYRKALESDPYEPLYYHRLGLSHLAGNELMEAKAAFEKMLEYSQERNWDPAQKEIIEAKRCLRDIETKLAGR